MRFILSILFVLCTNILLSQVNSFPYTESFEQSFNTGSNVDFIINWKGNTVAASNRIFAGSDPRTGNQSLNIIPTSSFKGTTEISLNLSEINNPKISFYAFSKQNGSSTSSRPILLSFSTSIDGGVTYTTPVPIGDATTFPNNDSTAYAQYTYELPAEASGIPNVIVKMVAERGSGLGSSAELVIDDFLIESQVLPLALTSAKAETHRTVLLKFNQAIIKASAENSTNYTIDNGITIGEALLIDPNTVQLLTSTLSNGPYEVAAFGIGEASTNTLSDTLKASFSFIEPLQVIALSIIDKQTIELEFNLDLDTAAAKISDYYSISPDIGHPLHIALDESIKSKITLSLAEPLEEETYVLVMNGLRDKSALAFAENLRVSFNYLPLGVSELSVVSATEIELTFNQKIEDSSAQLLANYGFNFDIQPILLSKSDSLINIRLNRPLVNNTYTISINNVTNLSGNAKAESLQVPFKYETATLPRQLIINEIFADPSGDHEPDPTVLPNESNDEYIELLNNTPNTINLKGFQLSGGTIGDFVVGPFDYMILTANSNLSLFQAFGDVAGVSSWNSLSNNGEQIILTDNLGNVVDSLTYDKSWYQSSDKADGGWSIEQINPTPSCIGAHNWSSSSDPKGGTPGKQNAIYDPSPDIIAPEVNALQVINDTTLQINFNETMDTSTLIDSNFSLSSGVSVLNITVANQLGTEVYIHLTEKFEAGLVHGIRLSNVMDCAGNAIEDITLDFLVGASPNLHDLIITEIMAAPSPSQGLPEVEYLELYNPSNKVLSIAGTILADAINTTILDDYSLWPNEYLILTPNSTAHQFDAFGQVLGVSNWVSLNNSEDKLSLFNSQGELIYTVSYSDAWYRSSIKSDGGFSLEMIDPTFPCLEESNWTASESTAGGSPGKINSVDNSNPDLLGPKLVQAIAINASTIQLRFNEKLNTSAIQPSHFSGSLDLSFIAMAMNEDERSLQLTTDNDLVENTVYEITANSISDCSGNLIRESDNAIDLIIAAEAKPRDIVINEILFNPKSGGARFVEIYNNSTNYINLSGWSLAGLTNSRILTEENLFMPPSTYYTITNDASVLSSQYPNAQSDTFIKLTSMPSLPSDEGQVSLINPSQIEIDAFSYNEDYHSPLLSDLKGISLERIKFSGQSEDPNNWFSASSTEYSATPGYENSQSRSREVQTGEISVAPLVFSPESSNGANFVTINYSFQTPGNTLNIKIVDAEGRMILELGQNVIAGKEGFLTWNGTTHQGSKARIGYYMVLLEIISPTGEIRYSKNKVVVGTQF